LKRNQGHEVKYKVEGKKGEEEEEEGKDEGKGRRLEGDDLRETTGGRGRVRVRERKKPQKILNLNLFLFPPPSLCPALYALQ
jgi:hypothetical protein